MDDSQTQARNETTAALDAMHDSPEIPEPNETDWLIIPKWEEFQHYGETRKPIWIKNYTRLLQDPAYLQLSAASRAVLHGLWLAYANVSGQLQLGLARTSLRLRFGYPQLIALNHAGFLDWSASKPLVPNKEVEVDKEPPYPLTGETHKTPYDELRMRAYDLALDWTGGSSEKFDAELENLQRRYRRRLSENDRTDVWNQVVRKERHKRDA